MRVESCTLNLGKTQLSPFNWRVESIKELTQGNQLMNKMFLFGVELIIVGKHERALDLLQ